MLGHARDVIGTDSLAADLCIIGSGPAGLTIAREMAATHHRVVILETGESAPSVAASELNLGTVRSPDGYPAHVLEEGRRRQLGGGASLWNHEPRGQKHKYIRCVPLDTDDFTQRDWLPLSGWPVTREELLPYYARAQAAFDLGDFAYEADGWHDDRTHPAPIATDALQSAISQFALPDAFLPAAAALPGHIHIQVLTGSHLREFIHDPLTGHITAAEALDAAGRSFRVTAPRFVLAAGGLENPRILLLNPLTAPGGPGNRHDTVGRCFMDHPSITLGTLRPASPDFFDRITFYDQHLAKGRQIMGKIQVRPEVRAREQLLNLYAVLVPHFRDLRSNVPFVLRELLEKAPRYLLRHRPHPVVERASASLPPGLHQRLLEGYFSECFCGWSRVEEKARHFGPCGVRALVELAPDPANRVTLGDATDRFGQRRLELHWRWGERDLASVRRTQQIFREEFAAAGLGDFEPEPGVGEKSAPAFYSPHHFMGTTRMSTDPRDGVVDAQGRVHGVPNLYVAGSSVFPTGGSANPTLTLVALSLRLADHLKQEMSAPAASVVTTATESVA